MELQLALALALPIHNPVLKGFDMNSHGVAEKKEDMGLETWSYGCCLESKNQVGNKRSFDMAFEKIGNESKGLPLLLWSGQPNEEDDGKGQKKRVSSNTKNDGEGLHLVGWPPIKSWRKKTLYHQHHGHDEQVQNQILAKEINDGSNSMYVKVKMEGVGIVRKINIKLHHSYQTLSDTLISMFSKWDKEEGADYTLAYQDKEGDWLLAGDVPWQTFIESVQRLKILRNGG